MWGRSGYSQYGYQQDYKQELRKLDSNRIIDFNRVNMGGHNVDSYLNNLSIDNFLYILKNGNQFDKNKINQLLLQTNKYGRKTVYKDVIQNPDKYKKNNRRSNGKNNKKCNNARKNGELKGELQTIKISLSNKNSNFSKKVLGDYKSILEYHERRLRNTKNNVSKNEKKDINDLLKIIKDIMKKKGEKNNIEKNKRDKAIENFREKLNTLIDKMEKSKRKYTTTIRQPTTITKQNLLNLISKVKEAKKEANKPAIFGKSSKSVSDASKEVLSEIDELLKNKNIPQRGGRKKYIINPLTGRKILKNGPTARKLNL
jgi:hypothetical protein